MDIRHNNPFKNFLIPSDFFSSIDDNSFWLYKIYSKEIVSSVLMNIISKSIYNSRTFDFELEQIHYFFGNLFGITVIKSLKNVKVEVFYKSDCNMLFSFKTLYTYDNSIISKIKDLIIHNLKKFNYKTCSTCENVDLINDCHTICSNCIYHIQHYGLLSKKIHLPTDDDICCICHDTHKIPILFKCNKHYACLQCVYTFNSGKQKYSCPMRCECTIIDYYNEENENEESHMDNTDEETEYNPWIGPVPL